MTSRLLHDAQDRIARLALRLLLDDGEYLLKSLDLTDGLAAMLLEGCLQILVLRGLYHFRQGR
jgi:hypothetical protein